MNLRRETLARIDHIPPLPLLVETLLAVGFPAGAPDDADMDRILAAAEVDFSLRLDLLELLNTPTFQRGEGCRTFPDALARHTPARLASLAVCVAAAPRLRLPLNAYEMPAGELLKHALVAGLAAEEIAKATRIAAPDHTFCAGFLGDIGKTCLDPLLADQAARVLDLTASELITFDQAEDLVLGINHAEAGAYLCAHWTLPPAIVEVVRWRLKPDAFPGRDVVLDLVHMGEALAKLTGLGLGLDGMYYQPSTFAAERLKLTPGRVDRAMAAAVHELAALSELFMRFGA